MSWIFTDDTENANPICNFRPEVLAIIKIYTDAEPNPVLSVKMRLSFGNNAKSDEFIELIANLEEIRWQDKDIRCRFHPEFPKSKAKQYLADHVRSVLPNAPTEDVYLE